MYVCTYMYIHSQTNILKGVVSHRNRNFMIMFYIMVIKNVLPINKCHFMSYYPYIILCVVFVSIVCVFNDTCTLLFLNRSNLNWIAMIS